MGNLPLHPIVVHFPLVLAFLAPVVTAGVFWGQRRGALGRRAWWLVVAAWALVAATGLVAMKTGQSEEDRVEHVVAESAIEDHEERAEPFVWTAAAVLLASLLLPLVKSDRLRTGGGLAVLAAGIVVTGLAIRVGHSGGLLVYEQGAAAAYATGADSPGVAGSQAGEVRFAEHDADDDDDDHRR